MSARASAAPPSSTPTASFAGGREAPRRFEAGEDAQEIPFLKRFTVFSVDQCENLPEDLVVAPPPVPEGLILPEVEALIRASGADLRLGGDKAFYAPALDYVQVPPAGAAYFEPVNWHRTALHELGHCQLAITVPARAATCRAPSARSSIRPRKSRPN
jgi:antirestriction protein ArdC